MDSYVYKANDYLQSNLMVTEFEKKYQELQANLETNKELIKKSVDLPDLVGLTVEEAHQELTKLKLNYSVYGFTNKLYKNGDPVPESKRGNEHWDNDKKDRIIRQDPSSSSYDYIIQDTTIKITVENKAVEKPIDSTDSSSTTPSDSSGSTTYTTSTTTGNFDK